MRISSKHLMTPTAAAREIGVTRQAVDSRIRSGKMKPVEVGGSVFVTHAAVNAWKRERAKRAKALLQ